MFRSVAVVVSCLFVLLLTFATLAQQPPGPGPPATPGAPVEGLQVVDSLGGVVGPLVTQNEGLQFFFTEDEVEGCDGTRYLMLEDALPPAAPLSDGVLYTVGHPVQALRMESEGSFQCGGTHQLRREDLQCHVLASRDDYYGLVGRSLSRQRAVAGPKTSDRASVFHGRPLGVAFGVSGLRRERRERHRYPFRRNPLGTPCHPTHLRTEGKPSNRCCLGRLKLRCRVERARPAQARGT